MRIFLGILAALAGCMAVVMMVTALTPGGSDLQIIGAGVFLTAMIGCLAGVGIMARLERLTATRKEA